jgi:hypothetical protein
MTKHQRTKHRPARHATKARPPRRHSRRQPDGQALDPAFATYLRSPMDPVAGPRMAGRVVGLLLRQLWRRLSGA